jgi:hypothetical protein
LAGGGVIQVYGECVEICLRIRRSLSETFADTLGEVAGLRGVEARDIEDEAVD